MKYKVEQELKKLEPELNYTVLRPAIVYGIADRRSLSKLLVEGVRLLGAQSQRNFPKTLSVA